MTPPDSEPDWFLREWMGHFGKRQADLVKELGWTKGRAHYIWHSQAPYHRETVNLIASWLGIRPYELLMHPAEAVNLRRLRETARAIAAEEAAEFVNDVPAPPHLGQRKAS